MIDGIKILCNGTTAHDWESNHLLKFASDVDITTGEIMKENKIAFYCGLYFHIKPSTVSDTANCIIQGSLAVFHNHGLNNAYDFDLSMLANTIQELQKKFAVNPHTAIIQTLEAGANININQPIKEIIMGLRAYENENFVLSKIKGTNAGRTISRTEYDIKIYDKGKQTGTYKNLLRIEYAFKKSRPIHKFNIKVLADLLNPSNFEGIKKDINHFWANVIFCDNELNYENMNNKDTIKMLSYLDATTWVHFTPQQRSRAKVHFKALIERHSTSSTQKEIGELLNKKLNELTDTKYYNYPNLLNELENKKPELKMLHFPHLDEKGKHNKNQTQDSIKIDTKKTLRNISKSFSNNLIVEIVFFTGKILRNIIRKITNQYKQKKER